MKKTGPLMVLSFSMVFLLQDFCLFISRKGTPDLTGEFVVAFTLTHEGILHILI